MHLRSHWWPSASSAAFLVSVLEMATFLPYLFARADGVDGIVLSVPAVVTAGILLLVVGVALQASAMWEITRQQEWIAPLTLRLSRLSIVAYVVVSGGIVLLYAFTAFGPPPADTPLWIYQIPTLVKSLSFGALALTSAHDVRCGLQRWACGGLAAAFVLGTVSSLSTALGWPVRDIWPWLPAVHVAVRAVMWVSVGAWLRTASLDQVTVTH